MSFEGYYQVICGAGHYLRVDCWEYDHGRFDCGRLVDGKKCGALPKWVNLVDDTNCDRAGYVEVVRVTEAVTQRCDLGHDHVVSDETFMPVPMGPLGALADAVNDDHEWPY